MATKPTYTKLKLDTFVDKSGNLKDGGKRINNFLDHFYDQKKFLTDVGLVDVFTAYLTYDGQEYTFDADTRNVTKERKTFLANLKQAGQSKGKLEFDVGLKYINYIFTIPITFFKKIPDFGGQGSSGGGKTLNKGNQFEKDFYADAVKVLEGTTKGNRFIPTILEMNKHLEKKLGQALGMIEGDPKFKGVLEEGSANKSRPLAYDGGTLVVAAEGNVTEDMGSTLTDITFQYGKALTPVYLSLKFGPTLTFFNTGVGGRNGPLLFTEEEISQYKVTTQGGLDFLKMFGMADDEDAIKKFCESFVNYPRTKAITNHIFKSTTFNQSAIEKLLRSGIGYGYWMVHNTKGTTIDWYEIDKNYMEEASKITSGITVYYGRMNGAGKGINMTCSSSHYNFTFNIRNKQGGTYPTHVMCDYKKKKAGDIEERPQDGGADYAV
tara:strand:+ start:1691 stop:2998 length:1308 start_codon:yes stop_codon:yes gene_type:complete